jgi:RNA polymerase sigma-70 factor (sigma-E family)
VTAVPAQFPDSPTPADRTVARLAEASSLELLRFGYLITGDRHRAEDLLQDALLALHRRFGDGPMPVQKPVAYARRTMTNLNITRSRRSSSSEVVVDLFDDVPAPSGSDPADRDLLLQALRRLPVRQRTVLVLRYYDDATDADIAADLGCRLGTVRSLASRALAALRGDPELGFSDGGAR